MKRAIFTLLTLITVYLSGAIITVPEDYNTIQQGIDAAQVGDTVIVSDGVYYENITFDGKDITVASHYILDGDNDHILNTIIDGSQYTDINFASCVRFISGEHAVLQGFTLTGGKGTFFDLSYIDEPIYDGIMTHEGGGIFVLESAPTIKNNLILNNEASDIPSCFYNGGGGISSFLGNPQIYNNIVAYNYAAGPHGYAPGIVFNKSHGTIRNNIICFNATTFGGAIFIDIGVGAVIENNTVVGNYSANEEAGLSIRSTESVVRANIVYGNEQDAQYQITRLENSIFEHNCTEESYGGEGDIVTDPLLDISDFSLLQGSPCIDAGNPFYLFNDLEDPDNTGYALFPSLGSIVNDMGAYGGPYAATMPQFDFQAIDSPNRLNISQSKIVLYQNSPNPFNPVTTIEYQIPEASEVELKIYNIKGQLVKTLVNESKDEGVHQVVWEGTDKNGNDVSCGVYFYKLISKDTVLSKKMILIK